MLALAVHGPLSNIYLKFTFYENATNDYLKPINLWLPRNPCKDTFE